VLEARLTVRPVLGQPDRERAPGALTAPRTFGGLSNWRDREVLVKPPEATDPAQRRVPVDPWSNRTSPPSDTHRRSRSCVERLNERLLVSRLHGFGQ
jgi:hypothetical protein